MQNRREVEAERKVLELVRKLIGLAGSPHEEEARTAAVTACKLIREHSLLLASSAAGDALKKHDEVVDRALEMFDSCKAKKRGGK